MNRVAWPKLMRLGMVELGLSPAVFWDLTPAELFLLAGMGEGSAAMRRVDFEDLLSRFPDAPRARKEVE